MLVHSAQIQHPMDPVASSAVHSGGVGHHIQPAGNDAACPCLFLIDSKEIATGHDHIRLSISFTWCQLFLDWKYPHLVFKSESPIQNPHAPNSPDRTPQSIQLAATHISILIICALHACLPPQGVGYCGESKSL